MSGNLPPGYAADRVAKIVAAIHMPERELRGLELDA
jgi:hypothetical protein